MKDGEENMNRNNRSPLVGAVLAVLVLVCGAYIPAQTDPLPSWNDGAAKKAIVEFDEAKKNGWTVISMKNDWKRVFAFDR